MSDNSIPENTVPEKRPSRFRQFGIRTLLLLVALAAVVCFLVRNEMVREERREKVIAELEGRGATWQTYFDSVNLRPVNNPPPRLWRERIGAWIRGKPIVPRRSQAKFPKGTSLEQFREFLDLFPTVQCMEIEGGDATKEVLQLLASRSPFYEIRIISPLAIDKELIQQLARIKCHVGIWLVAQEGSEAALTHLADAGVKVLRFDGDWGDEGLKAVARLPKIEVVGAGCRGTDEGVRALAEHPALANFSLEGANYTDASADVIPKLPALGELGFKRTSHTDAGLAKAITGCHAFSIAFENVAVGEETIAALANVPNLDMLYFTDVDLTLEQCDALAKLRLSYLAIDSKNFSDDHLARLSPLAKSLLQLSLKTPQVTDAGLAWLKQANALTSLHLNNTQATAATWSSLPSIATLRSVGIGGTNFNAKTIACTSRMGSLWGIFLNGSEIDDETLELLPPGIKFVRLDDTSVTPDGLKKLTQRKGITGVHVTRRSEAPLLIAAADVKEAQAAAGSGVRITYYEFPLDGCD